MHASFRHAFAALAAACLVALAGCESLPHEYPRADSHAWPHPEATAIGRAFADRLAAHPGLSAVRLLPGGFDAFSARVGLVEAAERTLDLQYYMVRGDESTLALMSRVVAAADRGVRVRMLVDDLY